MDLRKTALSWPVLRQLHGGDALARGHSVRSAGTESITPRTVTADRVVQSVCPYCAVGCGQRVYVKDEGSASEQLVNSPGRQTAMLYRRPGGTEWEPLDLETATDMIADRILDTRARTWQQTDEHGRPLRRTLGFAGLGGATLDNEENYLIKKLFTALGAIQIENQARI